MARADKADDAHARRDAGDDARHAVSTTTQRSGAVPIRAAAWRNRSGRLAARDLDGAEDVRVKAVVEADQRQGMLHRSGRPLRRRRSGNQRPSTA